MKRPFIIVLFLLLFFGTGAFSQPGYRPGYVVKNNGDTLFGVVFHCGDNKLLKECRFKHFDIGKEFRFSGRQIKGYGFRYGRAYASEGSLNKNGFMEVILSGMVTLLKSGSNDIYLSKNGKTPVKLTHKAIEDGDRHYADFREYLRFVMDDQPSLMDLVNNAELNLSSVAAVVREYNRASANLIEYSPMPSLNFLKDFSVSRNNSSTRLNIGVGYELALMHAKPNRLRFFADGDFVPSRRPVFAIQLEQRINRRFPGLFFDVGLGFYSDVFYRYAEYFTLSGIFRDDIYVEKMAVDLSLGLRYAFSSHTHKPFLGAGVTTDLIPRYSFSRYYEVEQNAIVRSYTSNEFEGSTIEKGLYTEAGYDFAIGRSRHISLELQYGYGSFTLINVHQDYLSMNEDVKLVSHTIGIGVKINL